MDRSPNLPRKANPWLPRVWAPGGLGSSSCNWRPKISIISSVFGGGGMGRSSRRRPVPGYQTLVRSRLGSKQEGGGAAAGGVRAPFPGAPSLSQRSSKEPAECEKESLFAPFPEALPLLFGSSSSKWIETGLELPTLLPMELFKARADCSVSLGAHSTWVFPRGVGLKLGYYQSIQE